MLEAEEKVQRPGKIRDIERELILKTLEETKGNKSLAAKILGLSVRTISNKLAQYRQEFPEGKIFPIRSPEEG